MKRWITALLAGAMALGPVAALAAIDNTHHDMPYMIPTLPGGERCTYCHSKTGVTVNNAALGKVGNFCVTVCHLSGTAAATTGGGGAIPTSPGLFTWSSGSGYGQTASDNSVNILINGHGMDKGRLGSIVDPGGPEFAATGTTGWPYTGGNQLQCTSCHTVHDAENPPFLNAKITDGSQTNGFCQRCHSNPIRQGNFAADATNHPIEFNWNPTSAAGRSIAKTTDTGTIMNKRRIAIGSGLSGVIINVVASGVANNTTDPLALNATTAHWNLGGHVMSSVSALPTSGATGSGAVDLVTCVSCHPVHQNGSASNPLANILTVGTDLVSVCFGCHTDEPGMSGYGHPIGPRETPYNIGLGWTALPLSTAYTGLDSRLKPASNTASPYCVSCHDVHDGIQGTGTNNGRMAIRKIKADMTASASACELCHEASYANPTTANQHHPGAVTTNYQTSAGFPDYAGWRTTDGLGYLTHGLSCPDCHVGDGSNTKRATAHNWQ